MREVAAGLAQRPGRSGLTVLGTALGVGTLVAILGLTATAQGQISRRFSVLAATSVTIEQVADAGDEYTGSASYIAFPRDAERRIEALNGVKSAGVWWTVRSGSAETSVSTSPPGTLRDDAQEMSVYAAEPGTLTASHATWASGRNYDSFHERRLERVAVLGRGAARSLGIGRLDSQPAIFINGSAFTVVGIIDSVDRNKEFLLGALVPGSTARSIWGMPKEVAPTMTVDTSLGAASLVARQAPLALRPDDPGLFRSVAPVDPKSLETTVNADLTSLFLVLAAVSLLIGTFGIANTTLVAVLERVPEIGVRRSVGARPRHIAVQFLAESASLGIIGGAVGTSLGIGTVLGVAITEDWSAIMPTWLLAAPALGGLTGLLAGLYPAWRASRIEPADALRR